MITDLSLALAAQAAYDEPATIAHGGVEVRVTEQAGAVIVAFRGTEFDGKDILRDLRAVPWQDFFVGWCHSGFLKGVRGVWAPLFEALEIDLDKGTPIYFTGHSKGGAEATVAAGWLAALRYPPAGLVTFGSPRCGFSRLGRVLSGVPTRRYVRGSDCVPGHPWPLWGYRHVGDAITLPGEGHRYRDHRIAGYVEAILGASE